MVVTFVLHAGDDTSKTLSGRYTPDNDLVLLKVVRDFKMLNHAFPVLRDGLGVLVD